MTIDLQPQSKNKKKPLTLQEFQAKIQGFRQTIPQQLLDKKGSTIRYAIDTLDSTQRRVISSVYRIGGILMFIDPLLRYMKLQNPYTRTIWSVQLHRKNPHERLRIWYLEPGTKDEILVFRNLVSQIDSGDVQVVKKKI